MNNDVMVSVFCLAYNHEKYIRKALEGFVCQKTNFAYEVFVHDDASTDGTAAIVAEFAEKYPEIIKPIYQTENQYSKKIGIVKTFIVPLMKGKYIAACEGDDYWTDPCKLQKQYDLMEANPQIGMCTHKVQCVSEDGTQVLNTIPEKWYSGPKIKFFSDKELVEMLFGMSLYPFQTSSYFIRRNTYFWEGRYPLMKKINGDVSHLYSALLHGGICYIDEIMSHRRVETIGSYNMRIKQYSIEKRMEQDLKVIDGYMLFDQLSGGKYKTEIVRAVYFQLIFLELFRYPDQEKVKAYSKQFRKSHKFQWKGSLRKNGVYILYLLAPGVLKKDYARKRAKITAERKA